MLPVLPAAPVRRARARALVAAAVLAAAVGGMLGSLAHVWPAPQPFVVPADRPPPARLVPMAARPDEPGGDQVQCLAFLDEWVRHPGWELTIRRGWTSCTGTDVRDAVTVDATGHAVWSRRDHADRILQLPATTLARLHTVAGLSCVRRGYDATEVAWIDVHWGSAASLARHVNSSDASDHLEQFLADLAAAHVARRLAERPDFRARFTLEPGAGPTWPTRPIAITVTPRGLTIRVHGRTVRAPALAPELLVDVMDWRELAPELPVPDAFARVVHQAVQGAGLAP